MAASRYIDKLMSALDRSNRAMAVHRKNRLEAIRAYSGAHYGDTSGKAETPVNFMELEVGIYTRLLAANNPAVTVTTRSQRLKMIALAYELAMDDALKELRFAQLMQLIVLDAYFGAGIVKFGLAPSGHPLVGTQELDPGEFVVDRVDPDDFVFDAEAKEFRRCRFHADRTLLDYEWVRAQRGKLFKHVGELEPDDSTKEWVPDRVGANDRVDELGKSFESGGPMWDGADDYRPQLAVWDIYVPHEQVILTVPLQNKSLVIRERPWDGPAGGPYRMLGFGSVPGNVWPLSPASQGLDLHELANALFVKIGNQALRQKTIGVFEAGSEQDAQRILDSLDGDVVRVDEGKIQELSVGGADQRSVAMVLMVQRLFNWIRGNLNAVGGLGPQSETATQDQLLVASASKRVQDMQARMISFVQDIVEVIAWFEWTDPLRERILLHLVPGTEVTIPLQWTPETRKGEFIDFNFEINPYSMQPRTPQQQLQTLLGLLQNVVLPLMPAIQQSGGSLDIPSLLDVIGRYAHLPELSELVQFQGATRPDGMRDAPQPAVMPAGPTTRRYERISRSGMTQEGKDTAMIAELLNLGNNKAESAAALGG